MAKFIEVVRTRNEKPTCINTDNIIFFYEADEKSTRILFNVSEGTGQKEIIVQGAYEEIRSLILS